MAGLDPLGDPERGRAAEARIRGRADGDLGLLLDIIDELRAQRPRERGRSERHDIARTGERGDDRRELDRRELVAADERLRQRGQLELADLVRALRGAELLLDRDEPTIDLRGRARIEDLEHPSQEPVHPILTLEGDPQRTADQAKGAPTRDRDRRADDRPQRARVVVRLPEVARQCGQRIAQFVHESGLVGRLFFAHARRECMGVRRRTRGRSRRHRG